MRKLFLIAAMVCAILSSCSEGGEETGQTNNDPAPVVPAPEIKLESSSADFPANGGTTNISFSSTRDWTAKITNDRANEWLSINPTSGNAGNAKISISTKANDTTDDRQASISIYSEGRNKSITVTQKQKDALTVTASKFEVGAEGGDIKIEVKANINFEYYIDDTAKDWVTYTGTRAMKTSTLSFKVAENNDSQKREAKIYIKSGSFNEVITIYQAGAEPSIVISKNEYVVSSDGDTISVDVTSNVDVAIELPTEADWIAENTSRAASTNTYRFDIAPNENYDQRSAEIKFTNKENGISEIVKVVQTQKDAIVVAKNSYSVSGAGEQIQIEVGHNIDFDIEIANDWITKVDTRAFTTETLTFNIATNTTNDSREGTIIFKSKDGKLTQIVKIYQAQEDTLIISKKDIVIDDKGGTVEFEIQTNVEFSVSNPDVAWVRAISTRGLTTHTLRYEVDANTSYDSREAKIIVTDTKNNKSETITITQAQKDAIVLAKDSYSVDSEGGQIQIEVGHNIDFDIEISDDWITKADTRAFTTEALIFNISKNLDDAQREGYIRFISEDGSLIQVVKITQEAYGLIASISVSISGIEEASLHSHVASKFGGNVSSIKQENGEYIITFIPGYTCIPKDAFYKCNWLKSVKIIDNIFTIEPGAFAFCENLTTVIIGDCVRELKSGKVITSYRIQLSSNSAVGLDEIGAFTKCQSLENIILGENLTTIGSCSFTGSNIRELTIPGQVKHIGDWAFGANRYLEKLNIGNSVISIGRSAFSHCFNLKNLYIPNSVTEIGWCAFDNCNSLTNITISEGVTSIGGYAFEDCI